MDYPKPLVTISLEEYNDLKQARQSMEDKSFDAIKLLEPYKIAITTIIETLLNSTAVDGITNLADSESRYEKLKNKLASKGIIIKLKGIPLYNLELTGLEFSDKDK